MIGIVAIGRNEGERLKRCLGSVVGCGPLVYVDSGSSDGSVAAARAIGAAVVELDMNIPFTAARARNEGFAQLMKIAPASEFVQFVDGDCEIVPGWRRIRSAMTGMIGDWTARSREDSCMGEAALTRTRAKFVRSPPPAHGCAPPASWQPR